MYCAASKTSLMQVEYLVSTIFFVVLWAESRWIV